MLALLMLGNHRQSAGIAGLGVGAVLYARWAPPPRNVACVWLDLSLGWSTIPARRNHPHNAKIGAAQASAEPATTMRAPLMGEVARRRSRGKASVNPHGLRLAVPSGQTLEKPGKPERSLVDGVVSLGR